MKINSSMANLLVLAIIVALFLTTFRNTSNYVPFVIAISVGVLFPFVVGPFKIHETQRTALQPNYKPFDPRGAESPPEVSKYYDEVEGELIKLGFTVAQCFTSKHTAGNTRGFVALFRNPKTFEVAKVIGAVAVVGIIRNASTLLVISTEFTDGTEIVTSNSRSPRIYPSRRPPYHIFTFPQILDAGRLLAIHRALVRRYEGALTRIDPIGNDPYGFLCDREFYRPSAYHVECGYKFRDELAGVYRPTWKGAILMTWKVLWPLKPIQLARRRFQARQLLSELETEGLMLDQSSV